MTIKLLGQHRIYAAGTIVTLDASTEAGLIAAKLAAADLTGGTAYVPPPAAPNQRYPVQVEVDANGNSVGVKETHELAKDLGIKPVHTPVWSRNQMA